VKREGEQPIKDEYCRVWTGGGGREEGDGDRLSEARALNFVFTSDERELEELDRRREQLGASWCGAACQRQARRRVVTPYLTKNATSLLKTGSGRGEKKRGISKSVCGRITRG